MLCCQNLIRLNTSDKKTQQHGSFKALRLCHRLQICICIVNDHCTFHITGLSSVCLIIGKPRITYNITRLVYTNYSLILRFLVQKI